VHHDAITLTIVAWMSRPKQREDPPFDPSVPRRFGATYRFGMSRDDYDNNQLVLNILHWLSRAIG